MSKHSQFSLLFVSNVYVEAGELQNSFVIVFSCWNTMIGTAVVALPWAFQQAGMALSIIISFTSFIVSFYTCKLIVDSQGNDPDFCVTLKKYYGSLGYYAGIISPIILMFGAAIVLFIILSQLSYPVLLALYAWGKSGDYDPKIKEFPTFETFSSSYTAIMLYFVLVWVSSKKNLGVFIRLGSLGAIFVSMLVIFILILGIYGFFTTDYQIGNTAQNKATLWANLHGVRTIVLFNTNFSPLAGILCTGYYLHTVSMPILRQSKKPENNMRNLFLSYFLVFMSYIIVGSLGYIGFIGTLFKKYFTRNLK